MRPLPFAPLLIVPTLLTACPAPGKDRPADTHPEDSTDTAGEDSADSGDSGESAEETDTSGESDSETGESGESDTGAESGGDTETGTVDSGPVEGPWVEVSVLQFGCVSNASGGLQCFDGPNADMGGVPPAWGPYSAFDIGYEPITCAVDWLGRGGCFVDPEADNWCELELAPTDVLSTVSVGGTGACGLDSDGVPVCWGCDPIVSDTPRASGFVAIDVGYDHVCAIDSGQGLRCWGESGRHGELLPPAGTYMGVSTASGEACAVSTSGFVECWGDAQDDLIAEPPDVQVSKVALGFHWACAILLDGELTCWGVGVDKYPTDWESVVLPTGPFVDISVGHILACAVREDGTLACFRDNGEPFTDGVP